jgi:hypothetical protein
MTAAAPLTPQATLGWLCSLSVDIREAAVLDASGALLAGDGSLADEPMGRRVLIARSEHHTIVVRHGRRALEGLLRADMQAALATLDGD